MFPYIHGYRCLSGENERLIALQVEVWASLLSDLCRLSCLIEGLGCPRSYVVARSPRITPEQGYGVARIQERQKEDWVASERDAPSVETAENDCSSLL